MAKINKLTRGSTPTLLEASKGNELIDAINTVFEMNSESDLLEIDIDSSSITFDLPNVSAVTLDVVDNNSASTVTVLSRSNV